MDSNIERIIKNLIKVAKKDKDVVAIVLYGSFVKKPHFKDIDVCLMLKPKKYRNIYLTEKRLKYIKLVPEIVDIQIFQQLPVYIRKKILEEGKILLNKDFDESFKLALSTIKEFDLFKPHYYYYLKSVENGKL